VIIISVRQNARTLWQQVCVRFVRVVSTALSATMHVLVNVTADVRYPRVTALLVSRVISVLSATRHALMGVRMGVTYPRETVWPVRGTLAGRVCNDVRLKLVAPYFIIVYLSGPLGSRIVCC